MKTISSVMNQIASLTCWDPAFNLTDLSMLPNLKHLTLLRTGFNEDAIAQVSGHLSSTSNNLQTLELEFILQEENIDTNAGLDLDLIMSEGLEVCSVDFKDNFLPTPAVGCSLESVTRYSSLVHVHLGQVVLNSVVRAVLSHAPNLKHFHCNTCPDLGDKELAEYTEGATCFRLECFYIYEARKLTSEAFLGLIEAFPELSGCGNLTRWCLSCDGLRQAISTIKDNNYDVEVLCGSHWFSSRCSQVVNSKSYRQRMGEEFMC